MVPKDTVRIWNIYCRSTYAAFLTGVERTKRTGYRDRIVKGASYRRLHRGSGIRSDGLSDLGIV